jgi:hypothetical protein
MVFAATRDDRSFVEALVAASVELVGIVARKMYRAK